jgi:hypothetical protein
MNSTVSVQRIDKGKCKDGQLILDSSIFVQKFIIKTIMWKIFIIS